MRKKTVMTMNNKKKAVVCALWIFVLMLIQTVCGGALKIKGVVPDLLFAFSLARACCEKNALNTVVTAFFCGVVADFLCNTYFLSASAIYAVCAVLIGFLKHFFIKPNLLLEMAAAFILFIFAELVCRTVAYVFFDAVFQFGGIASASLYNTVCFVIFLVIFKIRCRKEGKA